MAIFTLKDYLKMNYSLVITPDETTDGKACYLASHPELDGCMAQGETLEDARENLRDAKELYIETLFKKDISIPMPEDFTSSIWKVEGTEFSATEDKDIFRLEINPIYELQHSEEVNRQIIA